LSATSEMFIVPSAAGGMVAGAPGGSMTVWQLAPCNPKGTLTGRDRSESRTLQIREPQGVSTMARGTPQGGMSCKEDRPMYQYSHLQMFANNLPYMVMTVLGATVFLVGFQAPQWKWVAAGLYVAYGVAGAFWIMAFLCPFCAHYDTSSCPCGYGWIAAKLRPKKDSGRFREKLRKHIPVIVPLWFIPRCWRAWSFSFAVSPG